MGKQQAVLVTGFADDHSVRDDLVTVAELDVPEPAKGQYLVRLRYRPIHPADIAVVTGNFFWRAPIELPFVPGLEGVGHIEEAGQGATKFPKGTRVVALEWGGGTWQQFTVVDEDKTVEVPAGVSDQAASQFLGNPCTAFGMLDDLKVPRGEWLVQSAAGSVLGRMVIALAQRQGVRTLNLVRRSEQRHELLDLGADAVVATDQADWQALASECVGGGGAYAALDAVAGGMTERLAQLTRRRGVTLLYGALSHPTFSSAVGTLLASARSVQGWTLSEWVKAQGAQALARFVEVWQLFEQGVIQPYTGQVLPLSKVVEAIKTSVSMARGGKVLLDG